MDNTNPTNTCKKREPTQVLRKGMQFHRHVRHPSC